MWLLGPWSAFADPLPVESQSVQAVLQSLRDVGVEVIYSSDLVSSELRTSKRQAPGESMLDHAVAVLADVGLLLRPLGARRYVVVRAPQTMPPDAALEPLQELSVYASRYAIEGRPISAPRLLTASDIQQIPGAEDDPVRALLSLPGFASNASGRPYIRGSLTDDVLIRFDDVALLDPFHLKNFQSLMSAINPAAVARMEAYSGGFPVRFGTRSGGVIDIAPASRAQGFENTATVSLLALGVASVGHSDRWPLEWLATARRSTVDLVFRASGSGATKPEFVDSMGRLRFKTSEHSDWTLGWLLLDDRIAQGQAGEDEFATASYRDEYVWLAHRALIADRWRARTAVAVTNAERARAGQVNRADIVTGSITDERTFQSVDLTTDWEYPAAANTRLQFGANILSSRSDYDYARRLQLSPAVAATFVRPATDNLAATAAPRSLTYALYASWRQRWSKIETEIGVRLDGQHYPTAGDFRQWSPRLNVRYDLTDTWSLYGSLGRFTQAQRIEELRMEEGQRLADPAQISSHSILGLSFRQSAYARWSLEYYDKRWSTPAAYHDSLLDPLALLPDLGPDRIRITPEASEASGFELRLEQAFSDQLQGSATLSWSHVKDEFPDSNNVRSWDQPLALTGGLFWNGEHINFSWLTSWHRGWPRTPIAVNQLNSSPGAALTIGNRNSKRWKDFWTMDFRAGWVRRLPSGELSTFLEVTNASNRMNACCTGLEPADSAGGPLVLEVNSWLPILVNLGVSFRWGSGP